MLWSGGTLTRKDTRKKNAVRAKETWLEKKCNREKRTARSRSALADVRRIHLPIKWGVTGGKTNRMGGGKNRENEIESEETVIDFLGGRNPERDLGKEKQIIGPMESHVVIR